MRALPFCLVCLFFLLPGTAPAQQKQIPKPGDTVVISFPGPAGKTSGPSLHYNVTESGTLKLPLLGKELPAAGIDCAELGRRMAAAYRTENINPNLTVEVTLPPLEACCHVVTIEGGIIIPGEYPLRQGMTLMAAITRAGGFSPAIRQPHQVKLIRGDQVRLFDLRKLNPDGSNNPIIKDGDRIVVTHG